MTDTATLPLSEDTMRADIAREIDLPVAEVTDDESLMDLGLDSMQVMTLLMKWDEVVPGLDFTLFMEASTFGEWWQIARAAQLR